MPDAARRFDFGSFRLVPSERLLLRDGVPVPLREKLFETLLVLVENQGRLLTKEELIETVWPQTHVEESNLIHNISILRKTLGDQYIETVPKHGYRFVAAKAPPRKDRRIFGIAALAVVLSVSCYFVLKKVQEASAPPIRSIAILPLRTLSVRPDDAYLGFGIADSLITRLTATRQLVVRSITSVSRYTDPARDPIKAGQDLAVDAVLDGQIQQSGNDIRATLQLFSVADSRPLWSATFDGNTASLFQLEDAIASAFMKVPALATAKDGIAQPQPPTPRADAHEAYFKGRYFWNRRTRADFRTAIGFFRQAVDRDPHYALAWAGLADAYNMLGGESGHGRTAALRALELDRSLAPAHAALANVYLFQDWNFAGAEQELRRAIDLDPNYATAHQWYAFYLAARGNATAALAEIRRARDCDPTSLTINTDIGQIFYYGHRYPEAIAAFQNALAMDSNFVQAHQALGECYEQCGRYSDAARELAKAGRLGAHGAKVAEAARSGEQVYWRTRADAIVPELRTYYRQAVSNVRLGHQGDAFELLQEALEHHEAEFVMIGVEPAFDPLRNDPRFQSLIAKLDLHR